MKGPTVLDRRGNDVRVGDLVRVLDVAGHLRDLPEDEVSLVQSMVGQTYEVEEINETDGVAMVWAWRDEGDGRHQCAGIGLFRHEMELVR